MTFKHLLSRTGATAWHALILSLMLVAPAWAQLSFIGSSQAGFKPQTFTDANLKTINFSSTTLSNASGVGSSTSLGSSGGAFTATANTSLPTGFADNYAQVTSGTGSANGSKLVVSFTGGTRYVSFLWNLQTGDSDNTVKFNLSNGSSVTISNCSSNTSGCVGGYDNMGLFESIFSLIFGSSGSDVNQTARMIYVPPSGVSVNSVEFQATRFTSCALILFCSYSSRTFKLDELSYVDNSASVVALHHLELLSDTSSGGTCAASNFRVRACANAACTAPYTAGVTGTLNFNSGGGSNSFSIPSGQSVSGTIAKTFSLGLFSTTATYTVSTSSVTPAPSSAATCGFGTAPGGSCNFKVDKVTLLVSLPNQPAGDGSGTHTGAQPLKVNACVSTLLSVTLPLSVTATYSSANGTRPVINGTALTSGVASTLNLVTSTISGGKSVNASFNYNDVGPVQLDIAVLGTSLTNTLGLANLTARTRAIVYPGGLQVASSQNVFKAGETIPVKVQALTQSGQVAGSFGSESGLSLPTLATAILPAGSSVQPDALPALTWNSSTRELASSTSWDDVGTLDFTASLADYLGAASNLVSQAKRLRVIPAQFGVSGVKACGAFTYLGQPFPVQVTAQNTNGDTTANYTGAYATHDVQVSYNGSALTIPRSDFSSSATSTASSARAFTVPLPAAGTLQSPFDSVSVAVQGLDTAGVGAVIASTTQTLSGLNLRQGRIRLSNAYGSEKSTLSMPVQLQYWTGKSWAPAADDTCTTTSLLPMNGFLTSNNRSHKGGVQVLTTGGNALTLASGNGALKLTAPGAKNTGTVDVTLSLGTLATPMTWLRTVCTAANGTKSYCDPKATASFGVYSPESTKTMSIQDVD
ncbi:hypothetical protein EYS42_09515 [Aquabacterium lacunae]|uniref:DUF6701 domain-containing protein n=1 Tax=Aquabacterium lacunae TaxID=2528630 RepID=A0A4V2JFW1_9BURK|nr:DUF6701 domain-containing protein [Aquabacterium lacunae]TBO31458.1 hypothetical protein EYS42_09515 [Aquabacterium lacunae]